MRWMHEVEDEAIRTGVPILLGVGDAFERGHGLNQSFSQGARDEPVRSPDTLSRADL